MTGHPTPTLVVLSTGGTIASRLAGAAWTAQDNAASLVERLQHHDTHDVRILARDVLRAGSYQLTLAQVGHIVSAAHHALSNPHVAGIVITHGTDTLEETAALAQLCHDDPRPVVFTGAQLPADDPASDGPGNLADAVAVAAHPASRQRGPLIVFAGEIHTAIGTRKLHTEASHAFGNPARGPLGHVRDGTVRYLTEAPAPVSPAVKLSSLRLSAVRVDIVAYYPGADHVQLQAAAAAGARGIVIEAVGAGNANAQVARQVADLSARGVVVALSTRVPYGPVAARYGNGGGADLVDAGAIPIGTMRSGQARIVLAALLSELANPTRVRSELARIVATTDPSTRRVQPARRDGEEGASSAAGSDSGRVDSDAGGEFD